MLNIAFYPVSDRTIAAAALRAGAVDVVLAGPTESLFIKSRQPGVEPIAANMIPWLLCRRTARRGRCRICADKWWRSRPRVDQRACRAYAHVLGCRHDGGPGLPRPLGRSFAVRDARRVLWDVIGSTIPTESDSWHLPCQGSTIARASRTKNALHAFQSNGTSIRGMGSVSASSKYVRLFKM